MMQEVKLKSSGKEIAVAVVLQRISSSIRESSGCAKMKDSACQEASNILELTSEIEPRSLGKKEDVSADDWYRQESAGNSSEGLPEWLEDFAENFEIVEMPEPQTFVANQNQNIQ